MKKSGGKTLPPFFTRCNRLVLALICFRFVVFLVGGLRLGKLLLWAELGERARAAATAEVNPIMAHNHRLAGLHLRVYLIARDGASPHIHNGRLFGGGLFRRSLFGRRSCNCYGDAKGSEQG